MRNLKKKTKTKGAFAKKGIALLVAILGTWALLACDGTNGNTVEDNPTVSTDYYFYTDAAGKTSSIATDGFQLGVATDAGKETITFGEVTTGGANGTERYYSLTGTGEAIAVGSWRQAADTVKGGFLDFDASAYNYLVFWAKSALAPSIKFTIESEGGTTTEVSQAIDTEWKEYRISFADLGVTDESIKKIEAIVFVLAGTSDQVDIDEVRVAKLSLTDITSLEYQAVTVLTGGDISSTPSLEPADATVTYTINPALPTGVTLNSNTGEISGSLTAPQAATYRVTATGTGKYVGTVTADIVITVIETAFDVTTMGFANYTDIIIASGSTTTATAMWTENPGTGVRYSIDTELPSGMRLDPDTGEISVDANAGVQAATTYTVTATGNGNTYTGSATATISITIQDAGLPQFTGTISYETAPITTTVGSSVVTEASLMDFPTGTSLNFAISPSTDTGISIHSGTGEITVAADAPVAGEKEYTVTVTSYTTHLGKVRTTVKITVNAIDITTVTSALRYNDIVGTKNSPISDATPIWAATLNGLETGEYVATGLPSGLSIDSTSGIISGTPDMVTSTPIDVTVTVSGNYTGTASANIPVSLTLAYKKLGSDGVELAIQSGTWDEDNGTEAAGTKWSCVEQVSTGHVWEVKTTGGTRDKNLKYLWDGDENDPTGLWVTLKTYINAENGAGLCGYSDWVVPTIDELSSLGSNIDTSVFPNTPSPSPQNYVVYWSATPTPIELGKASRARAYQFFDSPTSAFSLERSELHSLRLMRKDTN